MSPTFPRTCCDAYLRLLGRGHHIGVWELTDGLEGYRHLVQLSVLYTGGGRAGVYSRIHRLHAFQFELLVTCRQGATQHGHHGDDDDAQQ